MLAKLGQDFIEIKSIKPVYKEFTTVWKEYTGIIFSGMENDDTIPVDKHRILTDLEIEIEIVEKNEQDDLRFMSNNFRQIKPRILYIFWEKFIAYLLNGEIKIDSKYI